MKLKTWLFSVSLLAISSLGWAENFSRNVVSVPAPAAGVALAPETVELNAISDDGNWLLFSSSSDRLMDQDHNRALDAFLLDRTTGSIQLLSGTPAGRAGNHTSFATGMSADGSHLLFQSRASDLIQNDTNQTWDLFLHDSVNSRTHLISETSNSSAGGKASSSGRIPADGRYILFASEAPDLMDLPRPVVRELFRRDLVRGDLVWVSQDLGDLGDASIRAGNAQLSSDGRIALFVMRGETNALFVRDMESGETANLSARPISGVPVDVAPGYSNPAISLDGSTAACRFTSGDTAGFLLYDLTGPSTISFGMNSPSGGTGVPEDQLGPELNADGSFAVYAREMTSPDTGAVLMQVFRWNRADQTSRLISVASNSPDPGSGHAFAPTISHDGRFVAFISNATDLTDGTPLKSWRAYLWDADTGSTRLIAELDVKTSPAGWVLSSNGRWLGIAAPGTEDLAQIHLVDLDAGETSLTAIEPAATLSTTGRSLIAIRSGGVSGDGRYAGILSLPAEKDAAGALPQVYLYDTVAGTRQLISRTLEGDTANGWSMPPWISRDGSRLLYTSRASNLTAEDPDTASDAIFSLRSALTHRLIRPDNVPPGSTLLDEHLQWSPDARYASLSYSSGMPGTWVVDLQSAVLAGPYQDWVGYTFSPDGKYLAGGSSRLLDLAIVDVESWLAGGEASPVWSRPDGQMPVFSGDGTKLAFEGSVDGEPLRRALQVIDWRENTEIFRANQFNRFIYGLTLDATGRHLAWIYRDRSWLRQAYHADTQTGSITLVSVAQDRSSAANANSEDITISPDGRYIAFTSVASNLVPNDDNDTHDVFLRDMQKSQTLRLSTAPDGAQSSSPSVQVFFAAESNTLFFLSAAANLSPGDYNQGLDLFKVSILDGDLLAVIRKNVTTGTVDLIWNGEPGQTYRVEFKETANGSFWQELATIKGPLFQIEVDPTQAAQRFFRIVQDL